MADKTKNPPAFPMIGTNANGDQYIEHPGMTLRDWFAGQALAGMLSHDALDREGYESKWFAEWSFEVADAMLVESSKKEHG